MRGNDNIEFPVIWVSGDSASLSLGKPGMAGSLIVDGGYLMDIKAHSPIIAVSGPDSKCIMYDGVILQNNYNIGEPPGPSFYQNGSGVFIRTEDNLLEKQAEFIMKGGVIRGNINDIQTVLALGGGVYISGFGIFSMEGGIIVDNTARLAGGGFHTGSRGSFRKTGGIVYGANAPRGYRNTALEGLFSPKFFGHALSVALPDRPSIYFRDDTVGENDNLSYIGSPDSNGVFGEGDKWLTLDTLKFRQRLLAAIVILTVLALGLTAFFFIRKRRKRSSAVPADVSFDLSKLSQHEKKIFDLLLTDIPVKQIAHDLDITYSGVNYHIKHIYSKLGVKTRSELIVKNVELNSE
jgi:DNA-binding CsgD family transcriptional regulator